MNFDDASPMKYDDLLPKILSCLTFLFYISLSHLADKYLDIKFKFWNLIQTSFGFSNLL
jgi:hypothetical protein